jgi:hypothetical protein
MALLPQKMASPSWLSEYVFSPIRTVSLESPIFKACYKGDIPEMKRLISQGQASVHDTTPAGRTLLHVSGSASLDRKKRPVNVLQGCTFTNSQFEIVCS